MINLGGTAESQKEFLEALSTEDSRRSGERHASKLPPIANSFALGYTYHDVLDADHEGMIDDQLEVRDEIKANGAC